MFSLACFTLSYAGRPVLPRSSENTAGFVRRPRNRAGSGPPFHYTGRQAPFPHPVIADAKLEAGDVSPQLLLDKAFVSGCFPVLQRPPVPPGRLRIPFFSKKPPADIAAKLRAGNGEPQSLQERGQRFFFLGQPIQAVGAVAAGVYLILPPAVRTF